MRVDRGAPHGFAHTYTQKFATTLIAHWLNGSRSHSQCQSQLSHVTVGVKPCVKRVIFLACGCGLSCEHIQNST